MSQQDDKKKKPVLLLPELFPEEFLIFEEEEEEEAAKPPALEKPLEKPDFWLTQEGLLTRLEMLAQGVAWSSFNNASLIGLKAMGITEVEWVADLDERTCEYCEGQSGRRYVLGMFMPELPIHPNCRCFWDYVGGE